MAEPTDAAKLRLLADWFDAEQKREGRWSDDAEVQADLRRIADDLETMEAAAKTLDAAADHLKVPLGEGEYHDEMEALLRAAAQRFRREKQIEQEERDVGPDLGGSPMEHAG